jgi:hypothetical protein
LEEESGFGIYFRVSRVLDIASRNHLVFIVKISALVIALHFVGSGQPQPGEFLILTDSLSSIEALRSRKISPRTHSVVYECKEVLWWLQANQFVVRLM